MIDRSHTLLPLLLLLALTLLSGCNATTAERGSLTARIIVKFTPQIEHPEAPAYLERLGEAVESELRYLHPLSGNAHLLQAVGLPSREAAAAVIERLHQHPDTLYAEEDRRRTTQ